MRKTVGRLPTCGLALAILVAGACGGGGGGGSTPDSGVPEVGSVPDGGSAPDSSAIPDAAPATEITCRALTPPAAGLCAVTPGSGALVLQGTVLAPGVVYHGGEVAIDESGVITCVGCDCAVPGATTVTCAHGVISPGLINTHDHITFAQNVPVAGTAERYEHRHDWRSGKRGHTRIESPGSATPDEILWAELRFVLGGATSTVSSGGVAGFLRNLDRTALQESLNLPPVEFDTFPLGDSAGTQLATGCAYPMIKKADSLAAVASYETHMAEGIDAVARNEFTCMSTTVAGGQDLVKPQTAIMHGIALTAADLGVISADGAKLVWSPRSNVALYGDTAPVTAAARLGIPIALGTDWIVSGSMNLLRELKCADSLNAGAYDRFFSDEDLWRMVTGDAALVAAVGARLGGLAVGKLADVAIFDGTIRQTFRAVIGAEPSDVALVLRGGKALYGEAAVVEGLAAGCDVVDVCGTPKRVCAMAETGKSYAALQASGGAVYPAFFCGAPTNEPTCTPQRSQAVNSSSVYGGLAAAGDQDGDGVADAVDNCPRVFNPVRPLDNGAQADVDGDGRGDVCDPCPLAAQATVCPVVRADQDGDGVLGPVDNCPAAANPEQLDQDGDGHGDVCDLCPTEANPGDTNCVVAIHDIKNGTVPLAASVAITGAVVTAVKAGGGFFAQSAAVSADHEGIYISAPTAAVAVGDHVRVDGTATLFFGAIELVAKASSVTAAAAAVPVPLEVGAAEVGRAGPRAQKLDGSLITIKNVSVQSLMGTTAYVIDAGLEVGKFLYTPAAWPAVGDSFASITGVLVYADSGPRLAPRAATDVVAGPPLVGPPLLKSLIPATTVVAPGGTRMFSLALDRPAGAGGSTIALAVNPPTAGTAPATVAVPVGATTASFTFTALTEVATATITATLDASTTTATIAIAVPDPNGRLVINEVDYDSVGTDNAEFIEIYNPSASPKALAGLAVVLVNGSNSMEYARIDLSGVGTLPADGYIVIAGIGVAVPATAVRLPIASDTVQNGAPDGIALIDTSTAMVIDALSYEGAVTAASIKGIAGTVSLVEGTVLPTTVADSNTVAGSLTRNPDGRDMDNASTDWRLSPTPTPGAANPP